MFWKVKDSDTNSFTIVQNLMCVDIKTSSHIKEYRLKQRLKTLYVESHTRQGRMSIVSLFRTAAFLGIF